MTGTACERPSNIPHQTHRPSNAPANRTQSKPPSTHRTRCPPAPSPFPPSRREHSARTVSTPLPSPPLLHALFDFFLFRNSLSTTSSDQETPYDGTMRRQRKTEKDRRPFWGRRAGARAALGSTPGHPPTPPDAVPSRQVRMLGSVARAARECPRRVASSRVATRPRRSRAGPKVRAPPVSRLSTGAQSPSPRERSRFPPPRGASARSAHLFLVLFRLGARGRCPKHQNIYASNEEHAIGCERGAPRGMRKRRARASTSPQRSARRVGLRDASPRRRPPSSPPPLSAPLPSPAASFRIREPSRERTVERWALGGGLFDDDGSSGRGGSVFDGRHGEGGAAFTKRSRGVVPNGPRARWPAGVRALSRAFPGARAARLGRWPSRARRWASHRGPRARSPLPLVCSRESRDLGRPCCASSRLASSRLRLRAGPRLERLGSRVFPVRPLRATCLCGCRVPSGRARGRASARRGVRWLRRRRVCRVRLAMRLWLRIPPWRTPWPTGRCPVPPRRTPRPASRRPTPLRTPALICSTTSTRCFPQARFGSRETGHGAGEAEESEPGKRRDKTGRGREGWSRSDPRGMTLEETRTRGGGRETEEAPNETRAAAGYGREERVPQTLRSSRAEEW